MARQARYDLAQTCRPRKLAVEQRNELSLGRQPPYPRIGTVIFHKSVEPIPRNMLQQPVKYAILMQHGLILFPVQNVAKRLEHRRINAMHLVHKKRTGQPWDKPGHDDQVCQPGKGENRMRSERGARYTRLRTSLRISRGSKATSRISPRHARATRRSFASRRRPGHPRPCLLREERGWPGQARP